jgi:hypothetical protein
LSYDLLKDFGIERGGLECFGKGGKMEISEFAYLETMSALTTGLQTDGAHHKQYCLEKALRYLVGQEAFEDIKDREEWEDGLPA